MDDLVDRLAVLSPPASRDLDVEALRRRVDRRRRRRAVAVGLGGVAAVIVGALGVTLAAGDDEAERRVETTDRQATAVPEAWGGPRDLVVADRELYVVFEAPGGIGRAGGGGIARLDPSTGSLSPIAQVDAGSTVEWGADSLWVLDSLGRWVDRLDAVSGDRLRRFALPAPSGSIEGAWEVVGGDEAGVWLISNRDGGDLVHLDADSGRRSTVDPVVDLTADPVEPIQP